VSRRLLDKARRRLAAESGDRANPWGGRLAVALVYPNTYHHAMSNLGFLTVYHLLNRRDDVLCERFFLPDPEDLKEHRNTGYPLFSLESGRFLAEFDLIAFSLSFENDYLHLPMIFELGRLPWRADARDERLPLLLAGGVCAFLNPEPLADVMDLFAVGEAEPILPSLLETLQANTGKRAELLIRLAQQPGLYVPSLYEATYDESGQFSGPRPLADIPARVERQYLSDLNQSPSLSFVLTPETEFGEMFLSEISRGCSRGCRFCAAGYIYLPSRERSFETLREQIDTGLCHRARVGLVGAAVSDHPDAPALQRHRQSDAHLLAREAPEVLGLEQGPIQPRRRNFQRVVPGNRILHVQHGADLLADRLAVVEGNPRLLVDIDPQQAVPGSAVELDAHQFVAEPLDRGLDNIP